MNTDSLNCILPSHITLTPPIQTSLSPASTIVSQSPRSLSSPLHWTFVIQRGSSGNGSPYSDPYKT